jgi:diaminopimelate epimerase
MEEIVFYKYEGTGNDFIMLDNRMKKFPVDESLIKHLCDRRFGIGADGLILLEQQDGYDFRMVYFNSDGRESTFCGNGGRCAAAFARQLGLVQDTTYFMAKDGEHQASFEGNQVRLKMSDAGFPAPSGEGFTLFTGSPHYVEFNADVMQADVFGQGRKIRQSFGEDGINVNFVEEKTDGILIRTYERGVEDETLSCGTGVTAAALLASTRGYESPVLVESKGGQLRVEFSRSENGFTGVFLTGPVRQVFSGTIRI